MKGRKPIRLTPEIYRMRAQGKSSRQLSLYFKISEGAVRRMFEDNDPCPVSFRRVFEHGNHSYNEHGKRHLSMDKYSTLLPEAAANKLGYFREPEKPKLVQYYQGVCLEDNTDWITPENLYKNLDEFKERYQVDCYSDHKLLPANPDFMLEDLGDEKRS